MNSTKDLPLALSEFERQCFYDQEFLLAKQRITNKNKALLSGLEPTIQAWLPQLPKPIESKYAKGTAKVSTGENYQGLPYQVLDFPRSFTKESGFGLRIMLWWGKEISMSLLLWGSVRQEAIPYLHQNTKYLPSDHLSLAGSPWQHAYHPNDYQLIGNFSKQAYEKALCHPFYKLTRFWKIEAREGLQNLVQAGLTDWTVLWQDTKSKSDAHH